MDELESHSLSPVDVGDRLRVDFVIRIKANVPMMVNDPPLCGGLDPTTEAIDGAVETKPAIIIC